MWAFWFSSEKNKKKEGKKDLLTEMKFMKEDKRIYIGLKLSYIKYYIIL